MKYILIICSFISLVYCKPLIHHETNGQRCVNMWDEGCINGQLPGSGNDDYYLNGGFNPGKRCVNMWDEGCINGQLNGAGWTSPDQAESKRPSSQQWLVGVDVRANGVDPLLDCELKEANPVGLEPRELDFCPNLSVSVFLIGNDDSYLNGGFNPGRRCVNMWDEGCINGQLNGAGNDDSYLNGGFNPGKRSLQDLFQRLQAHQRHQ